MRIWREKCEKEFEERSDTKRNGDEGGMRPGVAQDVGRVAARAVTYARRVGSARGGAASWMPVPKGASMISPGRVTAGSPAREKGAV